MKTVAKRVLVVDDDPVIGKSFDRVLSDKGYAVSTAHDGAEALKKFAQEYYDVVFADIKMPGMDGLEVAGRMRERRPWVPVVIITGYGTAAREASAKAMGVAEFLHKPLSPEAIESSTRKALRVIEGGKRDLAPETPAILTAPSAVETAAGPVSPAASTPGRLKGVALFLAAPFVALAYVIAFPFIGLGALAWIGVRTLARQTNPVAVIAKSVGLFIAAPFIGLGFAVAIPLVVTLLLAREGYRAVMKLSKP